MLSTDLLILTPISAQTMAWNRNRMLYFFWPEWRRKWTVHSSSYSSKSSTLKKKIPKRPLGVPEISTENWRLTTVAPKQWKFFDNELEPFEGVPVTVGLELVTKGIYDGDTFEGNWSLEWRMWKTTCLLLLPPSPFSSEIHRCHGSLCGSRIVEL
jgi:hypothetical protein